MCIEVGRGVWRLVVVYGAWGMCVGVVASEWRAGQVWEGRMKVCGGRAKVCGGRCKCRKVG